MEHVVVDDGGVSVAGECVPGVAVGAELDVQPLVQLVEDLLDTVGHPFAHQDLVGAALHLLWACIEVSSCAKLTKLSPRYGKVN